MTTSTGTGVAADSADEAQPSSIRRGPMRPRRLVSVRANQGKRLSSHVFRTLDVVAVVTVTLALTARLTTGAILSIELRQVLPFAVGAFVLVRALRWFRLYRLVRSEGLGVHLAQLLLALTVASAGVWAVRGLVGQGPSPMQCWEWIGFAAALMFALHTLWWLRVRVWRDSGWLMPNIAIVGATASAEQLINEALARGHVNVLGIFDDRLERSPSSVLGVPVLGDVDALLTHKIAPFLDRVVVAVDAATTRRGRDIMAKLATLPNELSLFVDGGETPQRSAALAQLEDSPLADLNRFEEVDRKSLAKRRQDLMLGIPLLILASPILLMLAILIKVDSRGPVFFRQRRHGFNNEEIIVWKFRSMRPEVADARAERQVSADDDRVTRIGRVLRKTSLDELPQLLNVVRGEMSLVGPRPHAIGMRTGNVESAQLVSEYAQRHRIKPGMTSWAAIHGSRGPLHAAADVQRRVALDVDYIDRQSLLLDLRIIAATLPTMLGDRHAIR